MAQSSQTRRHYGALELADNLHLGNAGDGFDMLFDGTNTLNIDPATANDILRVGETNQADVQIDGATDLVWDASAGSLKNGAGFVPVVLDAVREEIAAGTGGAISVATYGTDIAADAGGDTATLADGTIVGQLKEIVLSATAGGTVVVTPSNFADGSTITLTTAYDKCLLMWNGSAWRLVAGVNATVA